MSKIEAAPTATESEKNCEFNTRYKHPAFGKVVLSHPTGSTTLFGSDVAHHGTMCISVHRAHLDRGLHRDWIGTDELICEFELSAAQFAQFITSQGSGNGTPCTLSYGPDIGSKLVQYPAITKLESKMDLHRREVRESSNEQVKKIQEAFQDVSALMDSPSIPKKAIKEALFHLKCMIDNTPSNMEYTVSSAERAIEKSVSDAKIEIESFVAITTQRLGIKSLSQLAQIEAKLEHGSIPLIG